VPSASVVLAAAMITVTPDTRVINLGDVFVIGIHFASNGANREVLLQSQPGYLTVAQGASDAVWERLASLTTDANGEATYIDKPPDSRYYRAVFAGADDLGPGVSPRARALVRQVYDLRPTNGGTVAEIAKGTTITFTSTVKPVRPELSAKASFVVFRLDGTTWTQIESRDELIDDQGNASFSYTFGAAGKFYVRSVALPTIANANSIWSDVERFDVS
jgi:hypothetical protein